MNVPRRAAAEMRKLELQFARAQAALGKLQEQLNVANAYAQMAGVIPNGQGFDAAWHQISDARGALYGAESKLEPVGLRRRNN